MKKVPVVRVTTPQAAADLAGLPMQATVAMADVADAMREGLLAFSTAAGLVVMQQMLTTELTSIVGAKHAKLGDDRVGNWHGTTTGQVVLGGRKVSVERPRGRTADGGEVRLATWEMFASEDLLRQVVVERMLAGVATRRHEQIAEPVGPVAGRAMSKSAVSRRFVAATERALSELLARDLSQLETAVLMIDGLNIADQMIIVALVITADGTKVPVGMMLGDTENTVIVKDLLADLVARGFRFEHGILVVLDGSKALRSAVGKVFGDRALCSAAPSTSVATSPATSPSPSVPRSTSGWRSRSRSPTRPKGSRPAGTSPPSSSVTTPTPPDRCAKGSTRCSPLPGSERRNGCGCR